MKYMMDVECDEQAIQAVLPKFLGREEFGGIDNEALDFSQLEDYINDDQDAANLYFPEGLIGTSTQNKVNAFSDITPSLSSNGNSPTKSTEYRSPPSYTFSHNLPDSPPDSSSEPPFSPDNENKMNGGIMNSGRGVVQQPNHSENNNAEKSYHIYDTYNNTLPLKHLPEVVLPVTNTPMPLPPGVSTNDHLSVAPLQVHIATQPITANSTANLVHMNGGNIMTPPSYLDVTCSNNNHLPPPSTISPVYTICSDSVYTPTKKRKLTDTPKNNHNNLPNNLLNGAVQVKHEPGIASELPVNSRLPTRTGNALEDDQLSLEHSDQSVFADPTTQCIRFQEFQTSNWHTICDGNLKELSSPHYRVDADKGFNFSHSDNSFVCQKKNHFQITIHVQLADPAEPHYVKTSEGLKLIESYKIHFYGVKVESQSQTIRVEQSQSDRSKKAFHPVPVELTSEQVSKVTVGRMHFSETTSNNMRKKGKPNPDQRYFYLVVSLNAHSGDNSYMIVAQSSDRIIVRASNPGQFENDADVSWQKGQTSESIYHAGRVGVNTDTPDEALVVHGNLKVTGHLVQPSDSRAKENIEEVDSKVQLQNVSQMRIVKYQYEQEFAQHAGIPESDKNDTGVIAQEVKNVLPDAVKEAGDVILPNGKKIDSFLVVNKERIFMENVGAVKELCKVTDNLENRIDELERMNQKLRLKRIDSLKSTSSASTVASCSSSKANRRLNRRCRHHKEESNCVINRPVQITIFVLVLVMAICLISMATLYIYENRDKPYESRDRYRINVQSKNTSKSTNNHRTGWPPFDKFTSRPSIRIPVPVIGKPPKCNKLTVEPLLCPIYCCKRPNKSFMYNVDKPVTEEIIFDSKPVKSMTRTHASSRAMDFNKITSGTSSSNSLRSHSDSSDLMRGKEVNNDEIKGNKVPLLEDHLSKVGISLPTPAPSMQWTHRSSDNNYPKVVMKHIEKRSVNDNIPNSSTKSFICGREHILFRIPEFNFTLGSMYCLTDECRSNCAPNMVYEIPYSKYMVQQTIQLTVDTKPIQGTVFIFCNHPELQQPCPEFSLPHLKSEDHRNFRSNIVQSGITISLFKYSAYTLKGRLFKNSTYANAEAACSNSHDKIGETFIEYTFKFVKDCERE